jgi:hypothetical protein
MTVKALMPMSRGNHAPWASLVRLAARNNGSTTSSSVAAETMDHVGRALSR